MIPNSSGASGDRHDRSVSAANVFAVWTCHSRARPRKVARVSRLAWSLGAVSESIATTSP